jgi:hypothetical protein
VPPIPALSWSYERINAATIQDVESVFKTPTNMWTNATIETTTLGHKNKVGIVCPLNVIPALDAAEKYFL